MKTLFLLRHCEAYQFEEETSDYDKQLNENGQKSAELLNKTNNNGWDYWYVKRNEKLHSINDIRIKYRLKELNYTDFKI